jgi:hypothetical protein
MVQLSEEDEQSDFIFEVLFIKHSLGFSCYDAIQAILAGKLRFSSLRLFSKKKTLLR